MQFGTYYESKDTSYYEQVRHDVIAMIPRGTRRVLEVGCSTGATLAHAKTVLGLAEVVGIEPFESAAMIAAGRVDRIIVGDIEMMNELDVPECYFDCIICADVLEHLRDPWSVLLMLRRYLADDGVLLASIPNLRHISTVLKIVRDRFEYEEHGLLDQTHLRFFTLHTMLKMFRETGFSVDHIETNRSRSLIFQCASALTFGLFRPFSVFQYRLTCSKAGSEGQKAKVKRQKGEMGDGGGAGSGGAPEDFS